MPGFIHALKVSRAPAACFAGMGIVWGSFMATMPDFKARLGVDDGTFGVLMIWGSLGAIAMMTLAPRFGTPMGRLALPVFAVLMALGYGAMGQAAGPVAFVMLLTAMGMASGALDVFQNARLAAIEVARGLPLMNLSYALYSLAFAGAAALTGVARAAGWSTGQITAAGALTVLALASLSWERDGTLQGMGGKTGQSRAPLGLAPLLGGLLILASLMTENSVEAWSALFIERDLGGAVGSGSLAPALMGLMMGLGRLAGQGLAQRVPDRLLLNGGLLVSLSGMLVVVAAPSVAVAYAGFVVLGLGASVVVPTVMAVIGRQSTDATRGRAIARATVLGYIGYFIGPPLLGMVAELMGLRASFAVVAAVLLASLALAAALMRQDR